MAILTARQLKSAGDLAAVLGRLATYPELVPDRIDNIEPLRYAFEPGRLDQIAERIWDGSMIEWERRRPTGGGIIDAGMPDMHRRLNCFSHDLGVIPVLLRFLREEAVACQAEIGCVEPNWPGNLGSSNTMEWHYPPSTPPEVFDLIRGDGLYTIRIKDNLAQLAWATVFGPPYVRMFGRERLLSAPAAVVEEIAPEMIYIQVTPDVQDVVKDLRGFFAARRRVKEHIGPDAFFDPAKGKGPYRVPKFDLEPWPQPRPLGTIGGAPIVGLIATRPIVERNGKKEVVEDIDFGPDMFLIPGGKLPKGAKAQLGTIKGLKILSVDGAGHPVVQQPDGTHLTISDIQVGWHRPEESV